MPSLSFTTQQQLLAGLLQGIPLPAVSELYIALHNANPGGAGTQSTNETAYSNYLRVAVPCSPGSWLVTQNDPAQGQNIQSVAFPACGATGDTLNFWSIGYAPSGPGQIIVSGPIGATAAYGFSANIASTLYVPPLPPGLNINSLVMAYQFGPAMLLPNGLTEGQIYFVGDIMPAVAGFLISLSTQPNNAAPVSFSTVGTGLIVPVSPLLVTTGIVPTFPPNSLFTFMD